jgi:hypothetical protein
LWISRERLHAPGVQRRRANIATAAFRYEVEVDEAAWLMLRTTDDFVSFHIAYALGNAPPLGHIPCLWIDWARVAATHSGLIVKWQDHWGRRPSDALRYHSWGRASGFVWDLTAVLSFRPAPTGGGHDQTPPRRPTRIPLLRVPAPYCGRRRRHGRLRSLRRMPDAPRLV